MNHIVIIQKIMNLLLIKSMHWVYTIATALKRGELILATMNLRM
jgi:hypothetical protein